MTLYLVRHAHAGRYGGWGGPDLERPLTAKGHEQAEAITAALADATVHRVLSSRATRCQQTVQGLARVRGLDVEVHAALTEGATAAETTTLLWTLAAEGTEAVLASHGDVIPAALDALRRDGVDVDERAGLPKGTAYVLSVDGAGGIATARFLDPRP